MSAVSRGADHANDSSAHTEIAGRTILITGGTGSFGNRVAAHLSALNPRRIVIFSRDEKKQWEMQQRLPDFDYVIGDVRDPGRLREIMRGVDLVFHAAALKQVPSCEAYPYEAFQTNTVGSHNVCEAALRAGVRHGGGAQHGQGGEAGQRHGHVQGDDGEDRLRQESDAARRRGSAACAMET